MNIQNKITKSLTNEELAKYLSKQLNNHFPDNNLIHKDQLLANINKAEERVFLCFNNIVKKYFNEGEGITRFNHLISDQYCMYLYMLANNIYNECGDEQLCTKIYYLNKALHAVDIFYTTQLPDIFLLVHPLGTIIGRASFSDYFIAYQGCTVGCLNDGIFPTFKGKTILYANSSVLGNTEVGDNVCLAAGTRVVNEQIASNKIVFGVSPELKFRDNTKEIQERPPYKYG